MNKAFTLVELFVVIAIIAIIALMLIQFIIHVRKKANLAEQGTQATPDTWKTSGNMTPSGVVRTHIITDPTNNQKWIVVQGCSSCSIIPYVPAPITPEANK